MHRFRNILLVAVAGLCALGGVLWFAFALGASAPVEPSSEGIGGKTAAERRGAEKFRRQKSVRVRERSRVREASAAERARPDLADALSDDEVKMSPKFRALLAEIQAALDADDWKKTVALVQKLQDMDEWPDGIPAALHKAAIAALRWFGSRTAPELVGFLGSEDSEVYGDALDAMMDALSDFDIGDSERSSLLLGYLKVVKDADAISMMLFELNNMRPTVRAETALAIFESGNEVAINALMEELSFYFGDIDDGIEVTDKASLEKYLEKANQMYKDDPDLAESDKELYGGSDALKDD